MAIDAAEVAAKDVHQTVFVDTFTNGLLGPEVPMLGPVANGGHIVWNSTPGCWGPMITPAIRGGQRGQPAGCRRGCRGWGRDRDSDQGHRGDVAGNGIGQ